MDRLRMRGGAQTEPPPAERSGADRFRRLPKHLGLIPDGNRRWAERRGLARERGYEAGIEPGLAILRLCRELAIPEVSVYGFTKENVHRPSREVAAFRAACVELAQRAAAAGAGVRVVGDTRTRAFPEDLRPLAERRSAGAPRLNLLINYGWRWDLQNAHAGRGKRAPAFASAALPRIELVVRWGGRRRLSGFLPLQCAYADLHVVERLWPDAQPEDLLAAFAWYQEQDVTLGG